MTRPTAHAHSTFDSIEMYVVFAKNSTKDPTVRKMTEQRRESSFTWKNHNYEEGGSLRKKKSGWRVCGEWIPRCFSLLQILLPQYSCCRCFRPNLHVYQRYWSTADLASYHYQFQRFSLPRAFSFFYSVNRSRHRRGRQAKVETLYICLEFWRISSSIWMRR